MTKDDLIGMMHLSETMNGPVAIRYPRGRCGVYNAQCTMHDVEVGKGVQLRDGNDLAVLSIGAIGCTVAEAIEMAGRSIAHWDMRWLKPIDTDILDYVGTHYTNVVTVEDGMISGGLGSAVLEYFADKGYTCRVTRLGIRDQFVEHGSPAELYHLLKLDKESVCELLLQVLEK